MRKYIAEVIGTFALTFCGTGAIVINDISGGTVTHLGIAVTFGLIVTAVIYAFGNISGAHINPAVTIAFALTDRYDKRFLPGYIIAQILGALLASAILAFLFPSHETLGITQPFDGWAQTLVLEIILTYLLMLIILFVSQDKIIYHYTGIAVGAVVLLEALFAGPISGASMNPARSIAPAIISGHLEHLWIYIVAPIIGGALASWSWLLLKADDPITE